MKKIIIFIMAMVLASCSSPLSKVRSKYPKSEISIIPDGFSTYLLNDTVKKEIRSVQCYHIFGICDDVLIFKYK